MNTIMKHFNSTSTPVDVANYFLFEFWDEFGAPHLRGEYTTPLPVFGAIIMYLLLVLHYLPKYMENRKPYDLKQIMKYYNILNIIGNGTLVIGALYFFNWGLDCWYCRPGSYSPWMLRRGGELFFLLKIFDFLDTIFFVLRKKDKQITPLHLVHHAIMPFTVYCGFKFDGTPSAGFVLLINSFVHVVMYYYYHLSSQGPVWWKSWITVIQIVQFYLILIHSLHTFFVPNCHYNKILAIMQIIEASYFIVSFSHFYYTAYIKKKKSKSESTADTKIYNETTNSVTRDTINNANSSNNNNSRERNVKNGTNDKMYISEKKSE